MPTLVLIKKGIGKNNKNLFGNSEDKISLADWPIGAADLFNNGLSVK